MKRTQGWVLALLMLMAMMAACGRADHVSQETATRMVTRVTPMATVDEVLPTPPGPVMWCILGRDQGGRPMAVWIRKAVEGQVFLDQGTSREEAVSKARRLADQMGYSEVQPRPVLINPVTPTWWVAVKINEQYWGHIFVDFATGEPRANPNDPWSKS